MSALLIDAYADIVCPWCFIGFSRLNAAVQATGRAEDVAIRHRPFVIHPDAPVDGIDLSTMLERKYRIDPQRLFERVEPAALETGIPLDLSKQRHTYSTIAAHTLLRHAGPRATRHALTDSLFTAYFLHTENINEPHVLATIAVKHGFSAEKHQVNVDRDVHDHTLEEEREIRDGALDDTIAASFPASDPPSSIPNPHDHDSGRHSS